jgi:hypothetical protein
MNKLIELLCGLTDKIDSLIRELRISSGSHGGGVESSLFVISNTGDIPRRMASEQAKRVELWIHNASEHSLYLAPISDGDIGSHRYSLAIDPGDTLVLNSHSYPHLYKKAIHGFWHEGAPTEARAMITEFFLI